MIRLVCGAALCVPLPLGAPTEKTSVPPMDVHPPTRQRQARKMSTPSEVTRWDDLDRKVVDLDSA